MDGYSGVARNALIDHDSRFVGKAERSVFLPATPFRESDTILAKANSVPTLSQNGPVQSMPE
jgi:hypothetical protein